MTLGAAGEVSAPAAEQGVNFDYFTPDDLLSFMKHLDVSVRELDKAILTDVNTSSAFYNSFAAFLADWIAWYDDHTGFLSWFSRISNNVRDAINNYVAQYNSWRAAYLSVGGMLSASAQAINPEKPIASILDPLKKLGAPAGLALGHIALGILGVAAAAGVAYFAFHHRRVLL
jgi:hypothetical protein